MKKIIRTALLLAALSQPLILGQTASAQGVDPNIQSQIDNFAVRPTDPIVQQESVTVQKPVFGTVREEVKLTPEKRRKLLESALQKSGDKTLMGITGMTPKNLEPYFLLFNIPSKQVRTVRKQTGVITEQVVKPRAVEVSVVAQGSYGYESNATKNNANRRSDGVAAGGGSVQLKVPVGPDQNEGTVAFYASSTSVRYSRLTFKDFDLATGGAVYSTTVWKTPGAKDGLTTRDILSFGVEETSSFVTTYERATVNLITPSFSWTRTNIPLSSDTCGSGRNERFCNFGSVKATFKYTAADVASVDNSSARLEATAGWITPVSGLIASATVGVQGSQYAHVLGGRQDFNTDITGRMDWTFAPNATLSGAIKYSYLRSSVRAVNWDGFAATPQLKLSWAF